MSDLEIEAVANEMLRCKLDTHQKIEQIEQDLNDGVVRMDDIEASIMSIRDTLRDADIQRKSFNSELKDELKSIRSWFKEHDIVEMEKYDEIISSLRDLTNQLSKTAKETDENSSILHQKLEQEKLDAKVREALDDHYKDFREYKKKAITTAIGVATTGATILIWNIFMSGVNQ